MGELVFESVSHSYWHDGELVPSVTQVISPLTTYYRVPQERLRLAADRGTAVHSLTEQWDRHGMFTMPECDPECPAITEEVACDCGTQALLGYLEGWRQFRHDHDFTPLKIEMRVFHPVHEYAGTLDRIGMVGDELAVLDIKTSARIGPAMGVQLAAYQEAVNAMYPDRAPVTGRYVVQLKPDGTYHLEHFTYPHDFSAFLGCLALWHWQTNIHYTTEVRLQPPPLPELTTTA